MQNDASSGTRYIIDIIIQTHLLSSQIAELKNVCGYISYIVICLAT